MSTPDDKTGTRLSMTHAPPDRPVDDRVCEKESLPYTDVQGRLAKDPDTQRNREDAPDPEDLPSPSTSGASTTES